MSQTIFNNQHKTNWLSRTMQKIQNFVGRGGWPVFNSRATSSRSDVGSAQRSEIHRPLC
jgi:hypothetical protein